MVNRFDRAPMGSAKKLDNGCLRAPASLTRAGVFPYRYPDGSVVMELRHPDDVFSEDSLDTLRLVALTNDHPPVMLTSENISKYQVGQVGDTLNRTDDDRLDAYLMISEPKAIADVERGKDQVSLGYKCDVVAEAGEYKGERYDARQKNIRYNHASIVAKGRAGDSVKIRLDEKDAILADETLTAIAEDKTDMDIEELKKDLAAAKARLDASEQKLADAVKEGEANKARLDAALEQIEKAKAEEKERKDTDDIESKIKERVDARVSLISKAASVLGDEKLDGMSDLEIKSAVIKKLSPKADLEGKSPEYIDVRFDVAMDAESKGAEGVANQKKALEKVDRKDTVNKPSRVGAFIPFGGSN